MRFALLVALCALPCSAFETLNCAWDSAHPIKYKVSRGYHSKMIKASLEMALNKWCLASSCGFQFAEGAGGIQIKFERFYYGAAYTIRTMQDGKLNGATIVLNKRYRWCRKPIGIILHFDSRCQADLDAVLLHEVGHALGMEHSNVEYTTMWPYIYPSTVNLADDDIQGICSLYPAK